MRSAPGAPPGQGPTLAWFEPSTRSLVVGAVAAFVFMAVGVTFAQGPGVAWMSYWQPWLVIVALTALFVAARRRTAVTAGEGWVQRHGAWVRTYELVRVTAHPWVGSVRLHLMDQAGRHLRISQLNLLQSPHVWALVFAGIAASISSGGAQTNGLLRRVLRE